jgi:hypothetical protein
MTPINKIKLFMLELIIFYALDSSDERIILKSHYEDNKYK